jgi:exopolyphosphatase/guanosine-5'-triphosphate,3'-diphosphate pyrophosphatase
MAELIATIDVGTNTAHLLMAYVLPDGTISPIRTVTRYVRLGQGVDASGEVHGDAVTRLRETLVEFADAATEAGAEAIIAVGTSASRDVRDRDGLVSFVRRHAGIDYQIISGEEEALLTSLGAVSGLGMEPGLSTVVVDIGGGSTELTYARHDVGSAALEAITSLNIGSVRLTERCFEMLPPSSESVDRAERFVIEALDSADRPVGREWVMVGAAGTIRALALLVDGEAAGEDRGREATRLDRSTIREWRDRLLCLDHRQTLALNPDVLTGRADVIAAGVLILDLVFDYLGARECTVSPWGLRHGIAIRHARRRAGMDS